MCGSPSVSSRILLWLHRVALGKVPCVSHTAYNECMVHRGLPPSPQTPARGRTCKHHGFDWFESRQWLHRGGLGEVPGVTHSAGTHVLHTRNDVAHLRHVHTGKLRTIVTVYVMYGVYAVAAHALGCCTYSFLPELRADGRPCLTNHHTGMHCLPCR